MKPATLPLMTHPRHDGTLPSGVAPFEKGSSNARLPSTKKHKVIFGGPDHRLGNPGRAGLASREEYAAFAANRSERRNIVRKLGQIEEVGEG